MFGVQFYPTPEKLVDKMYDKVDWTNVRYVLEPSAGKGDLITGFARYAERHTMHWYLYQEIKQCKTFYTQICYTVQEVMALLKSRHDIDADNINNAFDKIDKKYPDDKEFTIDIERHAEPCKRPSVEIDCVEIDPNLCAVLKEKRCRVINFDFLQYSNLARYDLVLMNPPFKDGDKHLLKALELIKNGGQCVCILNAETIRNPHTNTRIQLNNLLKRYNADIEYMIDAFVDSENSTDVEIALIYVNIPAEYVELDELKGLVLGENYDKEYEEFNESQLATNDIIANLIMQYNFEAKLGIKVIDSFYSLKRYIPIDSKLNAPMLSLKVNYHEDTGNGEDAHPINAYIRALRDKYWTALFNCREFSYLLTEQMREKYLVEIRQFRNYDFTFSNIKQLQINLTSHLCESLDTAILKQFDDLTYKYSMDKDGNVHYFNGWRTNSAFMLRKKCIVYCGQLYDNRWGSGWSFYHARDFLNELEKIFTYLDASRTEGTHVYDVINSINTKDYASERIKFKYFDVEFKKKGTIHIWFTNDELLKKFNIFGCQKHGWLPNCYGKKKYKEMNDEEKAVIDSFEGKESYESVMINPQFYLGQTALLQLEMAR